MTADLFRTPIFNWHVSRGARMVDFAGWEMPVQYTSIVEEHHATRRACGVFDISHMGRLRFDGPGAVELLDRLLTRRVVGLPEGAIRYSLVTNEAGGILDDVLVYRLRDATGEPFHLLVVNASNRTKIVNWINAHVSRSEDVRFADLTLDTAMIAVQGPRALAAVETLVDPPVSSLAYYTGVAARIAGQAGIASRTGYTGEDGCELIVPAPAAVALIERIFSEGARHRIQPAGLGARDTLRLEAAMPLYGHELSETIDPYQAGLGFAVQLTGREFVGRAALAKLKEASHRLCRVGLAMTGKRVPREHYAVFQGAETVGAVTSGTFSPTLERPIAMAYVRAGAAGTGTELLVDIRGRKEPAHVVELPFYRREGT